MRRHPALSVLGLATILVGIAATVVLLLLLVLHAGTALHAILEQPVPPLTIGQALVTGGVLAVLLSFRR